MSDFIRQQMAAHSTSYATGGPTPAQALAGNYVKGRATIQGMPIAIENPRGSYRTGIDASGKEWRNFMGSSYGYVENTTGADGDEVDVFLGPHPESSTVYVIDQANKDRSYDEAKCMIGYLSEYDARTAYLSSYKPGWDGLGSITACTIEQFKQWLKEGDTTKPFAAHTLSRQETNPMENIAWDAEANPIGTGVANILYNLRREDADGLLLDAVTADDVLEDSDGLELLDALVVEYAKMPRKMEQLQKVMNAGGQLQVIAMQVTQPFKQRGTTNVTAIFELGDGQTVSVWFHNPDSTPNKIMPHDELVSWRWMLNKKDITLLVAPERGQDLLPREVARRIMRLADKNSGKFQKANQDRADKLASLDSKKAEVATKEQTLVDLDGQITRLHAQIDARAAATAAVPITVATVPAAVLVPEVVEAVASIEPVVDPVSEPLAEVVPPPAQESSTEPAAQADQFDPSTPAGYEAIEKDPSLAEAYQDQLDNLFQGRLIAVRNALRDLGWEGEKFGTLSKMAADGTTYTFEPKFERVGGGGNIVQFWPTLDIAGHEAKWAMEDRLITTPDEIAVRVDAVVAKVEPMAAPEPAVVEEPVVEAAVIEPIPDPEAIPEPGPVLEAPALIEPEPVVDVEPGVDEDLESAKSFLAAVIDGTVDYMDDGLADQLEAIHTKYSEDPEVMELIESAANAYSAFMVAQVQAV